MAGLSGALDGLYELMRKFLGDLDDLVQRRLDEASGQGTASKRLGI